MAPASAAAAHLDTIRTGPGAETETATFRRPPIGCLCLRCVATCAYLRVCVCVCECVCVIAFELVPLNMPFSVRLVAPVCTCVCVPVCVCLCVCA